jgi:hypothetical protein
MRLVIMCLAVALAAGVPSPAHAVTDLLPALAPVRADLAKWDLRHKGGKAELRFIGSIGNSGRGALHVRGERVSDDSGDMTAYQRITRSDGSTREERIGRLVYHAEHNHYHLDGVSRYRLLDAGGKVVREAPKVTFCLMDSEPLDGYSTNPVYHQCTPSINATKTEMGISVGWVDVYDKDTPGQSFDVTGLRAGEYTLEMTINPRGMLHESGGRNTASVKVKLD